MIKLLKKAILPAGFQANGVACGIKKSGKLDLALFYSAVAAKASCLFTTNKIIAAPLVICKKHLKNNHVFRGIIVNSGNANCYTGKKGLKTAQDTAVVVSGALGVNKKNILVASTGIIARLLPYNKIKEAVPSLVSGLSRPGIEAAKKAIMTTDTFSKEITVKLDIGGAPVTICGIVKGAGMIAPNMATLLCFIFSDANITQGALDRCVRIAVENSFNCITVDGCMSTNDSLMVMANGLAGNEIIDSGRNFTLFSKALNMLALSLAKMVVKDGEGATKFIQIMVRQAKNPKEAKAVALSIANSNLFKTAMFASSPNILGRIIAGIGASGTMVKEKDLKISYSPLKKKEVAISVSLKRGSASAVIYTSDLSCEYVKINAEYN